MHSIKQAKQLVSTSQRDGGHVFRLHFASLYCGFLEDDDDKELIRAHDQWQSHERWDPREKEEMKIGHENQDRISATASVSCITCKLNFYSLAIWESSSPSLPYCGFFILLEESNQPNVFSCT